MVQHDAVALRVHLQWSGAVNVGQEQQGGEAEFGAVQAACWTCWSVDGSARKLDQQLTAVRHIDAATGRGAVDY